MPHIKLTGKFIQLEQLSDAHREAIEPLAQDDSNWRYFPYSAAGAKFDPWFKKTLLAMENGEQLAFAVRRLQDQKIIGTTRFYDIELKHARLTIGHTWYANEARGTMVNPEAKLLLLSYAFEVLNMNRVEFTADARNAHSRAAIKKLSATEEGTLRMHLILENGYVRDTILFSIIKPEWPAIKAKLQARLA